MCDITRQRSVWKMYAFESELPLTTNFDLIQSIIHSLFKVDEQMHPRALYSRARISSKTLLCLFLTILLLNKTCPVLTNSVDPDQLASEEEANWSGSALFVIKYVNFYQKPGSSNLIGRKLEVGMAS